MNIEIIYLPTKTLHPKKMFRDVDEIKEFLRDHINQPYTIINNDDIWAPIKNLKNTSRNLRVLVPSSSSTQPSVDHSVDYRQVLKEKLRNLCGIECDGQHAHQLIRNQEFRDQFTMALDDFITKYKADSPKDVQLRDACIKVLGKLGNHILSTNTHDDAAVQFTSWVVDLNALCGGKSATLLGFLNKLTNLMTKALVT